MCGFAYIFEWLVKALRIRLLIIHWVAYHRRTEISCTRWDCLIQFKKIWKWRNAIVNRHKTNPTCAPFAVTLENANTDLQPASSHQHTETQTLDDTQQRVVNWSSRMRSFSSTLNVGAECTVGEKMPAANTGKCVTITQKHNNTQRIRRARTYVSRNCNRSCRVAALRRVPKVCSLLFVEMGGERGRFSARRRRFSFLPHDDDNDATTTVAKTKAYSERFRCRFC